MSAGRDNPRHRRVDRDYGQEFRARRRRFSSRYRIRRPVLHNIDQPSRDTVRLREVFKAGDAHPGLPRLPFESKDAQLSSRIEAGLEGKGFMVRRMDTMIAAIVIRRAARLYTYNIRHYERMKEFGLELFVAE